jgi:hypothetical protein
MKIPNPVLKLLVKPVGNLLLGICNAVVAAGITKLATLNADLAAQIDEAAVATFVWGVLMWAFNGWINAQLTEGPRNLQEQLNKLGDNRLDEDGIMRVDGETARELERLSGLPVRRAEKAE